MLPRARLGRAALVALTASTACGGAVWVDGTDGGKQSSTGGASGTGSGGDAIPFEAAGASNGEGLLFGSGGTGAGGLMNQGGTTNTGRNGDPGASFAGIYGAPPPPNSAYGGTGGAAGSGGVTTGDSDAGPDLDSGTPDGAANKDGAT